MTCLASKLKLAGYRTIAAGKWHAGMQHPEQTPRGRGYDAALTYFNPDNDYWANTYSSCPVAQGSSLRTPIVDLWEAVEGGGEGPAFHMNNSCPHDRTFVPNNGCMNELGKRCAPQWDAASFSTEGKAACIKCAMEANITACGAPINQSSQMSHTRLAAASRQPSDIVLRWCDGWRAFTTGIGCRGPQAVGAALYEDLLFSNYLRSAVATHQSSMPLFVFFAPHSAHTPMQAQEATLARFDFISRQGGDKPEHTRQTYTAMVAEGDAAIAGVVDAFRARGLWEHTLMVYSSDNVRLHSSVTPAAPNAVLSALLNLICTRAHALSRVLTHTVCCTVACLLVPVRRVARATSTALAEVRISQPYSTHFSHLSFSRDCLEPGVFLQTKQPAIVVSDHQTTSF